MTTKTITRKIGANTRTFIVEAIRDIMNDPDFGLTLTNKAVKRLRQAKTYRGKTISLAEIKKRYS